MQSRMKGIENFAVYLEILLQKCGKSNCSPYHSQEMTKHKAAVNLQFNIDNCNKKKQHVVLRQEKKSSVVRKVVVTQL